jgi:hypothetical protein
LSAAQASTRAASFKSSKPRKTGRARPPGAPGGAEIVDLGRRQSIVVAGSLRRGISIFDLGLMWEL